MESQLQDAVTGDKPGDYLRDPYPYFARKRSEGGVFHGTVMDYSKTPESLRPKRSFAAVSFDAVNKAFRDGRVFSSAMYDTTIGLFMGPTILAMEGKKHRDHRNLVSAAFKSKALARWEPAVVRPICDAL
ncbi:cytochrome P450 superfamily protein [Mycobacterium intracellulare subsp. chimaera]|nr:cytochrome P450 superfamily protein [Mycobacterium intracellulare subsp. chimaera]